MENKQVADVPIEKGDVRSVVRGVTDPLIIFVAGAIVGIALGPQIVRAVGGAIGSKANQVVDSLIERLVEDLERPRSQTDRRAA